MTTPDENEVPSPASNASAGPVSSESLFENVLSTAMKTDLSHGTQRLYTILCGVGYQTQSDLVHVTPWGLMNVQRGTKNGPMSRATVTRHLRELRDKGLVKIIGPLRSSDHHQLLLIQILPVSPVGNLAEKVR
jgi:DNA-binding transcriptional ArsR family regulator